MSQPTLPLIQKDFIDITKIHTPFGNNALELLVSSATLS